jgi:hypothetical protein
MYRAKQKVTEGIHLHDADDGTLLPTEGL